MPWFAMFYASVLLPACPCIIHPLLQARRLVQPAGPSAILLACHECSSIATCMYQLSKAAVHRSTAPSRLALIWPIFSATPHRRRGRCALSPMTSVCNFYLACSSIIRRAVPGPCCASPPFPSLYPRPTVQQRLRKRVCQQCHADGRELSFTHPCW